jgi:ABC-2 type transport system ATP-binding protein
MTPDETTVLPMPGADVPATAAPPPLPLAPPATTPRTPVIETQSLTRRFGQLTALNDLNLQLDAGDLFGFIGPNGAGKSTTMKIIAGLLEPTSGRALIHGRPVASNGDYVRRNVGYMPDSFGVYDDLTVTEYLEFFASAYRLPRAQRRKVVSDVLDLTDLVYKKDAAVDSLSRGMQQRLGLARVLVHDPPVLLLDEPASGLDPRARIEIRELLKTLRAMGKTIMVSSHILSELGEFSNKLGIIERGSLIVSGTVEDLMRKAHAQPATIIRVVDEAERAHAILSQDARVSEVVVNNGDLRVMTADPALHHHCLIELLVAAGIRLHSVAPQQLKLEDVFLRLTKGLVQ